MGQSSDCTPETAAAVGFGVVTAALEYARREHPDLVSFLEDRQLNAARVLIDIDKAGDHAMVSPP